MDCEGRNKELSDGSTGVEALVAAVCTLESLGAGHSPPPAAPRPPSNNRAAVRPSQQLLSPQFETHT